MPDNKTASLPSARGASPSEWEGHPDDAAKPCSHMRSLLSALSDGKLSGVARWYTEQHTARCEHCKPAFASLMVLKERIRVYGIEPTDEEVAAEKLRLDPAKRAAAEAAWARIDSES